MMEEAWLTCKEPGKLLQLVERRASARQFLLIAAACCRRFPDLLADALAYGAIDMAEQAADGGGQHPADQALRDLWDAALQREEGNYVWWEDTSAVLAYASLSPAWAARQLVELVGRRLPATCDNLPPRGRRARRRATREALCGIVRDVIGTPFRPVPADPGRVPRCATVAALARSAYDDRDLGLLPILADALEEAGCADDALLSHCRSGEHTRGCWALDLVLGKIVTPTHEG